MSDTSPRVIDLHSHSTRSDGMLEPADLVAEAHRRNIHTLALTDHDTTAGLDDAEAKANELGIEFVPGVEITCECAGTEIHVLGIGVDRTNAALQRLCTEVQQRRRTRFFEMCEKLRQIGIPLTTTGVEDGVSLARPYLARMLVQQGYVKTYQEAFNKYLKKNRPAYIENRRVDISEAIEAIRAAHGLSFVAHPGLYKNGDDVVDEANQKGVDGIECYHSDHYHDKTQHFAAKARKFDLLISGGADFHAPDHARAKMFGKKSCPPEEYERIREALAAAT